MALPTKDELQTLDYSRLGLPFVFVEAKALSTAGLDVVRLGLPFVGAAATAGEEPPAFNAAQFFVMF
jgi:hypothetical protein